MTMERMRQIFTMIGAALGVHKLADKPMEVVAIHQLNPIEIGIQLQRCAQARYVPTEPNLDVRHSIVDLLKALDMDSSMDARRELWGEFFAAGSPYTGTPEQNEALHREVMSELATPDLFDPA
jgi:hypothetical protein